MEGARGLQARVRRHPRRYRLRLVPAGSAGSHRLRVPNGDAPPGGPGFELQQETA